MFIAGIATIGSGLLGAYSANKTNKANAALQAKANEGDPRKNALLYGEKGQTGLLSQYQDLGKTPESAGLKQYGEGSDKYLGQYGQEDMQKLRDSASVLQGGGDLGSMNAYAVGNMVNAPKQNGINLSGSYDRFINGDAGANPYLTQALQGGINQSTQAFSRMQDDSTRNLRENILPQIGSNAVLAGQYGGSRQGVAEGRAIGDFGREQQRAIENFGNNNTSAAVGAQASSFNQGQDRALAATQGLGAQQYGVAHQNANTQNQAEFNNVNQVNDLSRFNAQLSGANRIAGLGAQQGLLGQTVQSATNQDNYGMNRATQTNNLLSPYLSSNPAQQVAPQSSVAGSALGGAATGLGLLNAYKQATDKPPTVGATADWKSAFGGYGS